MSMQDIWIKLPRTYARAENNMRVFQIKREIDAVVQGDRTIQEYAIDLERLWADYDHCSLMTSCKDPECKWGEIRSQDRTMQFLRNLNPAFDQRRAMLLAQTKIPPLDEVIAAMMQEESRMKLHSEANGSVGMRSTLVVSNSGMTRVQGETRRCYNCGEVGHLRNACPRPPKKRETGGRGQIGGRGRGRGGRRGGIGAQSGGYRTNLTVTEKEAVQAFTEEDQELLEMLRRKLASDWGMKPMTEEGSTSLSSRDDLSREGDWSETWDWHMA